MTEFPFTMTNLILKATNSAPMVEFNCETCVFTIEGRSILEDPSGFYMSIYEWLEIFLPTATKEVIFNIKLEYVNSSSSKYLTGLFRLIDQTFTTGKQIVVNWFYDEYDESIMDLGMHYRDHFTFPINLIQEI